MFDRWFFITVLAVTLVLALPLVIVWFIVQMSPELRLVATIAIIVTWGVAAGYKDWVISKRTEKENEPQQI